MISGKLRFVVDGETRDVETGDSWCFKGGVEHSAEALEDSIVIEVFSPVREDYL
jgi:quercetin dioxygenase-like cupin family protein